MSITKSVKKLKPIHPGEILREEFLRPMGLSANRLATEIHVPATRVSEITNERRSITAETALRLARYFGTSPQFWIALQAHYDLEVAEEENAEIVEREVRPMALHG